MITIKASKSSMLEEFELKGYWWLPGSDNQVSGILFYDNDEIRLELLGTLEELSKVNKDLNQHDIIIGFSERGEKFTLISCMPSNFSLKFPGYSTESYSINSFIVGGHFDSIEQTSFHSVSFFPTYLTTWLEKGPFEVVLQDKDAVKHETQIKYVAPEVIKIEVPSINTTIEDTYKSNLNGNLNEHISWIFKSGIKIIPDNNKSLNWFEEKLYSMNSLLTLLFGMPIFYENIIFYGDEKQNDRGEITKREEFYWFFNQHKLKIKDKIRKTDFMISYAEIKESFPNIVNSWFDKEDKLKTVYDLYISDFYKDIYIDTSFLNVIQMLETYHRKTHNGKIFDDALFEKYRKEVIQFVTESLPEELHDKFTSKYGNEYSLSQRLKEIMNELSSETINTLFISNKMKKKFIQQLVDTRNYLTHFDDDGKKNILTSMDDKYYAIIRLRALNTILLFKEVGIEEDIILQKIKESKQYSYSLKEANKILIS